MASHHRINVTSARHVEEYAERTQGEVATLLGISRGRVGQLERSALSKIRRALDVPEVADGRRLDGRRTGVRAVR